MAFGRAWIRCGRKIIWKNSGIQKMHHGKYGQIKSIVCWHPGRVGFGGVEAVSAISSFSDGTLPKNKVTFL